MVVLQKSKEPKSKNTTTTGSGWGECGMGATGSYSSPALYNGANTGVRTKEQDGIGQRPLWCDLLTKDVQRALHSKDMLSFAYYLY